MPYKPPSYQGQYGSVFFPGLQQTPMAGPYINPYEEPMYPSTNPGYGAIGPPSTFSYESVGSGPTAPDPYAMASNTTKSSGGGLLPIGTGLAGIAQLAYGLHLANKMKGMSDPRFTPNEFFARGLGEAQSRRNMGFTGDEMAAYEQNISDMNRSQYSRAINMAGGNMAQTVLGILSGQESKARGQMAMQDAALRRQNQQYADTYAARMQELNNAQTAREQQQYDAMRAAASQAIQSGIGNIGTGLNAVAGLALGMPI